jgi:hypoxanthine phosphoribosyltransferase
MKPKIIQLHDKEFKLYIPHDKIISAVKKIAREINKDYKAKQPVFLSVLNGAFMFTADLMKEIKVESELSFVKLASYKGTQSGGNVKTLIGLDVILKNRNVIIVEDIVDSGKTMSEFMPVLKSQNPASIHVASIFIKPDAIKHHVEVKYAGLKIPNDFIVGYGLDYDGLGRNLKDVYRVCED